MTFLLDVNVLIALMDPAHVRNESALAWFAAVGSKSWATCPMTENAVLRIIGHSSYPNSLGSPSAVARMLTSFFALGGHVFWPDDISSLDAERFDAGLLITSGQVADSYLLALAVAHGGKLATFDRRLAVNAVKNGAQALFLLE
jgi:hypothetical protein